MRPASMALVLWRLLSTATAWAARRTAPQHDLPSLAAVATRGPLDMRLRAVLRIRRCMAVARRADGTLDPAAIRVLMFLAHHLPRQPQSLQLRVLEIYGPRTCAALVRTERRDLADLLRTSMEMVHSASSERGILAVLQRLRDPEPRETDDSLFFFRTSQLQGGP